MKPFEIYEVPADLGPLFSRRPNRIKIDRECSSIVLYHGGSSTHLEKLIEGGIKPRGETGVSNYDDGLTSSPGLVYLGDLAYATMSTDRAVAKYGGHPFVAQVVVETANLRPDEDRIHDSQNNSATNPNRGIVTTWWESLEDGYNYGYGLFASCAHQGTIALDQLRNIWIIDGPYQPKLLARIIFEEGRPAVVFDDSRLKFTAFLG